MGQRRPVYIALLPVLMGIFIAADDQTVIVTVLPQILLDLDVQVNELDRASWTITGYLLGYVAAMPLIGRMSDVWGHRNLYVASMLVFMAGSVAAALTTNLTWFVAARVLQAIGAGALLPISIAIVGDLFPPDIRGVPLGLIGAASEAGAVIGPMWGGLIGQFIGWPWVFWINIPLGILTLVPLLLLLDQSPKHPARIDYIGGALLAAALCAMTLALARVDARDMLFVVFALSSGVTFSLFIFRQQKTDSPLLPLCMFRTRAFGAANATHLLIGGALIIGMVTIPLMANTVLEKTALEGGLMLMRMTIAIPVGAALGGLACQRMDSRIPTALGLLLVAAGFWLMSSWATDIADPAMTLHLGTAGLGFGLLIAPIALAAINSVPAELRGAASAVVTAMRVVGMTFGLAALTAWGTGRFQQLVVGLELPLARQGETAEQTQTRVLEFETALTDAGLSVFNDFFLIAMAVSLIAILPTMFMVLKRCIDCDNTAR
ncbi:MAG: MFS transporter [Dehalococcoidia bacterium]|nr:MFS transporter [Dehalococcoidia bacterium]